MTILIITNSYDLTSDYIINKYSHVTDIFRFNTDNFSKYNIVLTDEENYIEYKNGSKKIDLNLCESIYFRKIALPTLDDYEEKYREFMYKEMLSVVHGIAEIFGDKVLTRPSILRRADNKVVQMKYAKQIGFNISESMITNSDLDAKEFCDNTHSIIKPISTGQIINNKKKYILQTNLVNLEKSVMDLEYAPSYFQKYLEKDYEVRLTVINKEFYGVRIDSTNKIDWRKSSANLSYSLIEVPLDIKNQCLAIMDKLNIEFAAFDFIIKNETYYFLEFNANGQWLWLEIELELNISKSIVEYLIGDHIDVRL